MKWHPDKNQGKAFVSVSVPSKARMLISLALGMRCTGLQKTFNAGAG